MTAPVTVAVPLHEGPREPKRPERVRALKRSLIQSLRDLRAARRPEKLIQRATVEPAGFAATVLRTACATCEGLCCTGGGDHAYLDERTLARVRRDHPDLDARAIIGLYVSRVPETSYRESCLFHGPTGCTLGRALRAELCNAYLCTGLQDYLQHVKPTEHVRIHARRNGLERHSDVLTPPGRPRRGQRDNPRNMRADGGT